MTMTLRSTIYVCCMLAAAAEVRADGPRESLQRLADAIRSGDNHAAAEAFSPLQSVDAAACLSARTKRFIAEDQLDRVVGERFGRSRSDQLSSNGGAGSMAQQIDLMLAVLKGGDIEIRGDSATIQVPADKPSHRWSEGAIDFQFVNGKWRVSSEQFLSLPLNPAQDWLRATAKSDESVAAKLETLSKDVSSGAVSDFDVLKTRHAAIIVLVQNARTPATRPGTEVIVRPRPFVFSVDSRDIVDFQATPKQIVASTADGRVCIFDLVSGALTRTINIQGRPRQSGLCARDTGNGVLAATVVELDRDGSNGDEGVVVFTASEDTTPRLFARGAGLLRVLDFSNDAKSLWCDVANANRLLNIDMQTGALDQIQYANFEPSSQPTIARINEDDSGIVIFSATGIKEISVKSGQKTVWQREAIGDAVWAPATRSVGKEVAVEYDRSHHTLFAISLQTGKDLWQKSGFVDIANIRAGSSDGAFLAVVRDGTVKIIPTMGEGEVTAEGISDQYECRFCSDSAYLICIPRMVPQPEPGGAIYIKRQSNVMKVINSKSGKLACTVNPN